MSQPFKFPTAVLALCLIAFSLPAADEVKEAKDVLQTSGIRTGLCIDLACGRSDCPGLAAALAENSSLLVHGFACDEAALGRARKAIESRNMAGRATAECVSLKPLPFLPDMATLVVVEDFGAVSKAGLSKEDILRVVAPEGVLCILEGGKWSKTVKPTPSDMDQWTHTQHGPDGNMVSNDKVVMFPIGVRWIDGLPMNTNMWASCRGWIVAGGRCFTLSANEIENIQNGTKDHYLSARDAFSGIPLWKINCGTTDNGAFLNYNNAAPLAADAHRVYAVQKGKIIGVDAATGQIAKTFETKYLADRLLLVKNTLVAACWQERIDSKADFDKNSLWATWVPKSAEGTVDAWEAESGKPLWSLPLEAASILASDTTVYALVQAGNPPTERNVVALDLQTGKERWRITHTSLGTDADLQLNTCGPDYLVIAKRKDKSVFVLSAADGHTLWQIKPAPAVWTPVVDGLLWSGGKKYDLKTGEVKGNIGWGIGDQACTPQVIVNSIMTQSRGCQYVELPSATNKTSKAVQFAGARGACMEGMVPAYGMFYTAQNNCQCAPAQMYGFLAIGPCGNVPAAAEFEAARTPEQGPAFGKVEDAKADPGDWPTFRHDSERTAAVSSKLPDGLRELWRVPAIQLKEGPLDAAWKARLCSPVSAPVCAEGKVFVAGTDSAQLVALDANSGSKLWTALLSSRVDTPPTIYHGLCLIGCHDGYVYALRAKDGQLAWRSRIAPAERRMVAYGSVESVWPAIGTVLIHDNVAYANAGRTSESDGGIAVVALEPATGKQIWAKVIGQGSMHQNDLLCVSNGMIDCHHVRLDPKTGEIKPADPSIKDTSQGGMLDGTWTWLPSRRSGKAFQIGKVTGDLAAWNDKTVITPAGATNREKGETIYSGPTNKARQVEALALAENGVVYAGRVAGAKGAPPTGFVSVVSLADSKSVLKLDLEAPPAYDGAIIAHERIYIALQNGNVVCIGK